MAIKINGKDLQRRVFNGQDISKVMYNGVQIRPDDIPPTPTHPYLILRGAGNECKWRWTLYYGWGAPRAFFETSRNGVDWDDYVMTKGYYWDSPYRGPEITLYNGDEIYIRNKSNSVQSIYGFRFQITTGYMDMIGDVGYLLCKNSTNSIPNSGFYNVFAQNTGLKTPPSLPATILNDLCYYRMFGDCTGLTSLPSLPSTILPDSCYAAMFQGCENIKLSTVRTGEYQTPYSIPISGTGTGGSYSVSSMFDGTGGTFTGTPSINTTYYTSNQVI